MGFNSGFKGLSELPVGGLCLVVWKLHLKRNVHVHDPLFMLQVSSLGNRISGTGSFFNVTKQEHLSQPYTRDWGY